MSELQMMSVSLLVLAVVYGWAIWELQRGVKHLQELETDRLHRQIEDFRMILGLDKK